MRGYCHSDEGLCHSNEGRLNRKYSVVDVSTTWGDGFSTLKEDFGTIQTPRHGPGTPKSHTHVY